MSTACNTRSSMVSILTVSLCAAPGLGDVIYVDGSAPGPVHDGASWCQAFLDLQDALAAAEGGDEIRVADGVYRPDGGSGDRTATYMLVRDVALRGGYGGCGAADPDERDFVLHETILCGDLDGDDGPGFANNGENAYHIVTNIDDLTDENTILDGFTIRRGNANEVGGGIHNQGSGVHNHSGSPFFTGRLFIDNCRFEDNWAWNHAALNDHGGITLANSVFERNHAELWGGALYIHTGPNPTVTNCQFFDNTTAGGNGGGGAMFLATSVLFTGCHFENNHSDVNGGAIYLTQPVPLTFTDCTFVGNTAWNQGGALYAGVGQVTFEGCQFSGNHAIGDEGGSNGSGGAVWAVQSMFTGCSFDGNTAQRFGGAVHGSNVTMDDCQFSANTADTGGAIRVAGTTALMIDCTFDDNVATRGGGGDLLVNDAMLVNCLFRRNAADRGAGLAIERGLTEITNALFRGNNATDSGGAIAVDNPGVPPGDPVLDIFQSTFAGNVAGTGGGHSLAVDSSGGGSFGEINVVNSIMWDGLDTIVLTGAQGMADLTATHSNVAGSFPGWPVGSGNIDADPQFADADGDDDIPMTNDDDVSVTSASPSYDTGLASALPIDAADIDGDGDDLEPLPIDLAGNERVLSASVDMGAYEFNCDVGAGAGADCNANGVPDRCDLDSGDFTDNDGNGVLDVCEACAMLTSCADVDSNGIRDDGCVWWGCSSGVCEGTDIHFGDMGGQFGLCAVDGAVDGNDRFHALNCFANMHPSGGAYSCEHAPPAALNVDAGGAFGECAPDGVCDGNDAFHALNAFAGRSSCSCPLDGEPAPNGRPGGRRHRH